MFCRKKPPAEPEEPAPSFDVVLPTPHDVVNNPVQTVSEPAPRPTLSSLEAVQSPRPNVANAPSPSDIPLDDSNSDELVEDPSSPTSVADFEVIES